jgi:DNA primase
MLDSEICPNRQHAPPFRNVVRRQNGGMTTDFFHLAAKYHQALPERLRTYLNSRGIPDAIIDRYFLGWNGSRITIPVFNEKGICASFRLAKDPDDSSDAPKMLSMRGSSVDLYGWEALRLKPQRVAICEGEFDRLVLAANGFPAVTSTGGAGSFDPEWADAFADIPEVFICFDRDEAGRKGALRVSRMITHAKLVELPEEVGEGGDITDFFVRLGRNAGDFEKLLAQAISAPPEPESDSKPAKPLRLDAQVRERVARIKREIPIERIVGSYLELRASGATLVGLCPFHEDHSPSFTVFPETRTFYCFGCRMAGDVLSFLQKVEHLTFHQALRSLEQFQTNDRSKAA